MKLLKYRINDQCEMQVKKELERLDIPFRFIDPGVIELFKELTLIQRKKLNEDLFLCTPKFQENKKGILIEKIKSTILEMIQYSDGQPAVINSEYLSIKLNHDYTYLANIFSEVNGISIQQFIILSKIEKVKELLLSDDHNLTEISYKLHYSSVAHLSSQFKKMTGHSPSGYKLLMKNRE